MYMCALLIKSRNHPARAASWIARAASLLDHHLLHARPICGDRLPGAPGCVQLGRLEYTRGVRQCTTIPYSCNRYSYYETPRVPRASERPPARSRVTRFTRRAGPLTRARIAHSSGAKRRFAVTDHSTKLTKIGPGGASGPRSTSHRPSCMTGGRFGSGTEPRRTPSDSSGANDFPELSTSGGMDISWARGCGCDTNCTIISLRLSVRQLVAGCI